jgi:hypothetical protein
MAKLVTYNTLVRVGRAILTEAQASDRASVNSLTGEFKGYIDSQADLSSSLLAGDFYIADSVFTFSYDNSVMAVSKDSIIIALKNNPSPSNREDWVIIKSTLVNELLDLKASLQNHINNKNNPHQVTLIQANGEEINDSTFSNLLNEL